MIVFQVASRSTGDALALVDSVFHAHGNITGNFYCGVSRSKWPVGCFELFFKEDIQEFIGGRDVSVEFFGPFNFS